MARDDTARAVGALDDLRDAARPRRPGLTLFTYTAEPGSRTDEALKLLGSWAATADAESASATDVS